MPICTQACHDFSCLQLQHQQQQQGGVTPTAEGAVQAKPPSKTPWKTPPPLFTDPKTPATAAPASGWQDIYDDQEGEPPASLCAAGNLNLMLRPLTAVAQANNAPAAVRLILAWADIIRIAQEISPPKLCLAVCVSIKISASQHLCA